MMENSTQIQLNQLKTALKVVVALWEDASQDASLSSSRQSISREHADIIKTIFGELAFLNESATADIIHDMVVDAVADAMLIEIDKLKSYQENEE